MNMNSENTKALCSAIVLQAVNDYKYCTRRIKAIGKKIATVKKMQIGLSEEVRITRGAMKTRRAVINWQARIRMARALARARVTQAEAYRKELKELHSELNKCERMIFDDIVPFFEGDWCDSISPIDGKELLNQLKSNDTNMR
ncbi:MAG TPA: hypothetical protein VJZ69_03805 [Clostridia bacterium]|nr:hypothetical protein [Clostridia bacterium]